jgi:hypothetical protein
MLSDLLTCRENGFAASFDANRVLVVPSLISSSLRFELSPPPFVASASWSIDAIDSSSLTSSKV